MAITALLENEVLFNEPAVIDIGESSATATLDLPSGTGNRLLAVFVTGDAFEQGMRITYGGVPLTVIESGGAEDTGAALGLLRVGNNAFANNVLEFSVENEGLSGEMKFGAVAWVFDGVGADDFQNFVLGATSGSSITLDPINVEEGELLLTFAAGVSSNLALQDGDGFETGAVFESGATPNRYGAVAWRADVQGAQTLTWTHTLGRIRAFAVTVSAPCTDEFNCDCEPGPAYSTLAELRARVIAQLGFVELKPVVNGETLADLRLYLMRRLGYAAVASNPPPGMTALLDEFINEAQAIVWRRYAYDNNSAAAPSKLTDPSHQITIDNEAVKMLALGRAKAHYGQPDAKTILQDFETYLQELLMRRPLNLETMVNNWLQSAQKLLYHMYSQLHTERIYTWTMQPGQRFYGLMDAEGCCPKQLDAYKVTWVGWEDLNGAWLPLCQGIPPELYTRATTTRGFPERYEIRSCIEIFPAPQAAYKLRIKGHFGLEPFTADSHRTTIDDEAVFLLALGNAKTYFKQPDAQNILQQANSRIRSLVAGTHHTARYVSGRRVRFSEPEPRFLPLEQQ